MAWRDVVICREREEIILNVTALVVRVWGGQYTEELILNITVVVVRVWGGANKRGTDTECYCDGWECLGRRI
jgi:hypothetical protein